MVDDCLLIGSTENRCRNWLSPLRANFILGTILGTFLVDEEAAPGGSDP
jgi:hypothetical protein